jgi:hypothetical protein
MHTAYYAFLKQAKLWELHNAIQQPDPEAEVAGDTEQEQILAFPPVQSDADVEQERRRRAA